MRANRQPKSEAEPRSLTTSAFRADLSETLSRVAHGGETVLIERKGRPLAALISYDEFRLFQRMIVREQV